MIIHNACITLSIYISFIQCSVQHAAFKKQRTQSFEKEICKFTQKVESYELPHNHAYVIRNHI